MLHGSIASAQRFIAAVLLIIAIIVPQAHAATGKQIDDAIKKGKQWLYSQQNANGNWEYTPQPTNGIGSDVNSGQWGGLTAIATYALLASGETRNDPRIDKAVSFLENADIKGTYAIALRCQVWALLGNDKEMAPYLRRDSELLLTSMFSSGTHAGMFGYSCTGAPPSVGYYDHSCSQYGVLGLWALQQSGVEIPASTWRMIDRTWRKDQHDDGGWSYQNTGEGSPEHQHANPSMTAAGVATLFITQDFLPIDSANCRANPSDENILRGLNWMDLHVKEALNPGYLYAMYGIERIGAASGHKYFGTSGWYDAGADGIIAKQAGDGNWGDVPNTAFAMFFLVRGRAPVLLNKLQYQVEGLAGTIYDAGWNERPRDVAHLAHWLGKNLERELNWQIVNLRVSGDDLHDAPILYIAGSDELRLPASDLDHLREFIEGGGMILGNADCGKKAFAESFVRLGQTMFPNYKFRELPEDHPIYTREQYSAANWKEHPSVLGLSNGVRELMILVPEADLGRAWQAQAVKRHETEFQLGSDIFVYGIDKTGLRYRGQTTAVRADPAAQPSRVLKVARLQIGQNWDPEPGGWRRMSAILHNDFRIELNVQPLALEPGSLSGFQVAHLTGTASFTLNDAQRKQLKDFVSGGGTLIVDAAGGSQEFAKSARAELGAVFPDAAAKGLAMPLPPFHVLYNLPEASITEFLYRSFARKWLQGDIKSPRMLGLEQSNRVAVFFSPEDLTAGMVGEQVDGIYGYTPETATAIMRNILIYAAGAAQPKH